MGWKDVDDRQAVPPASDLIHLKSKESPAFRQYLRLLAKLNTQPQRAIFHWLALLRSRALQSRPFTLPSLRRRGLFQLMPVGWVLSVLYVGAQGVRPGSPQRETTTAQGEPSPQPQHS